MLQLLGFIKRRSRWFSALVAVAFAATLIIPAEAVAEDHEVWLARAFSKKSSASGGYSGLGAKSSEGSSRRRSKGVEVASLGGGGYAPKPSFGPSLSGGGGVKYVANAGCLNSQLRGVISSVASSYGAVTVSSTCRSHSHNASVGGAPKSYHLSGDAADFRVHGNWGAAYSYLQGAHGGGLKHYGGGLFHIDTGPRRPF